jgi:hypothetical protein
MARIRKDAFSIREIRGSMVWRKIVLPEKSLNIVEYKLMLSHLRVV